MPRERPGIRLRARLAALLRRAGRLAPIALAITAALLAAQAAVPAPAHAVDLFPVDDWLGDGIKKAGDVVLGPLKFGAKEIARLLATIVGALADLLVPNSFVRAGLDGVRWLVELPPLGEAAATGRGGPAGQVRMPHLAQLREVLTWIGLSLLPLGLVIAGGRAVLAPTVGGDSPADVFSRIVVVGFALIVYDWLWGVVIGLSRLLTEAVLGLPWVDDGIEQMLQTLVIGGAAGTVVAAEFVIPLLLLIAGTALLGLLLVRIGLEIAAALLYVFGGLVLGLSVTAFGWRLLYGWLIAAAAIVALPLIWSVVFATGAALMLDAGPGGGRGFVGFIAQLYNVAAALAVFWIAIKLALGVFRHASGTISTIARTPAGSGGSGGGAGRMRALAENATPAGLVRFSQQLRGRLGAAAGWPMRRAAQTARAPVQSTQRAASALRDALAAGGVAPAAVGAGTAATDRGHGGTRSSRAGEPGGKAGAAAVPSAQADPDARARPDGGAAREDGGGDGNRAGTARGGTGGPRAGDRRAGGQSPPSTHPASAPGGAPGPSQRPGGSAPPPRPPDERADTAPGPPRSSDAADSHGPGTAPADDPTRRPWWLRRPPRQRSDRDEKDRP